MAVLDATGRLVATNESWEAAAASLNPVVKGMCGTCILDATTLAAEPRARFATAIGAVLRDQLPQPMLEFSWDDPAGRHWCEVRVQPLGRPARGAVLTHQDVTARKRVEGEAQRHLHEVAHVNTVSGVGELAAAVAHELNQPLTAVLSNAQAARRILTGASPCIADVREILDDIIEQDKRAGEVIQRIRRILKKDRFDWAPVDLNVLVRDVVSLLGNQAALGGVKLASSLDPRLPCVRGDRVQLQQVVLNLLLNAIQAASSQHAGAPAVSMVTDRSGTGGPAGRGRLGARHTTRKHDPHLRSVLHDQARWPGRRPVDQPLHHRSARRRALGRQPGVGRGGVRRHAARGRNIDMSGDRGLVFIVDDDDAVGTAMARVLRASGFDAQHFTSASAFLRHRTDDRPACVLLDLRMPDVNGLELQKTLTDAQALTVVFLTGHADVKTSVAAMKAGAVDFLTKPVEEELLLSAVSRAVERSAAAQAGDRERVGFLARLARLTPRERQVGALVIQGLLNKQIAGELGTAEKTVKVHRARVMEKLKVGSVAELARLAERTRTLHVERPANGSATGATTARPAMRPMANWRRGARPDTLPDRSPLHAAAASAKRGRS